jgi:hypothetical protein
VHHNNHNPALREAHGGGDGIRHLLPAYCPGPFDLGIHTPLNTISTAAATEGSQLAHLAPSSDPAPTTEQQPVSLIEAATKLARDRAEEYNAKLKVFQAFCAKFEEAAKQFTTGPERELAQKVCRQLPRLLESGAY